MEGVNAARHCAFCLIPIAAKDVKNCGKCLRRAYCGQKCQKMDWKSKKQPLGFEFDVLVSSGQGHKDWCGLPVCEEDLDWYVKESGKGVIAKRLILKGERIFVGNMAQYEERFTAVGRGPEMFFNHSCDANAASNLGMDYNVTMFTAEKDIQPASEITVNYVGFNLDFTQTSVNFYNGTEMAVNSFADGRKALKLRHKIICPSDCFCYNEEIEQRIILQKEKCLKLKYSIFVDCNDMAVDLLQKEIAEFDAVRGDRVLKAQRICSLIKAMGDKPEYADQVQKYTKEALDIFKVFHPNSPYCGLDGWMSFLY